MDKSNHFSFATKVWLISAFLSPLLFGIYIGIIDGDIIESFGIALVMIPFGLVLSVPNWLIFIFAIKGINRLQLEVTEKKIIINCIAIVMTFTLFMIIFQGDLNFDLEFLGITLPYCSTLTLGIWRCDLIAPIFPDQKKVPTPNQGFLEDILDDENY